MREVHGHILPMRPGLANFRCRKNHVRSQRILRVHHRCRLQVRDGLGPTFLIVRLPLHHVIEPLDFPHAGLADIVILVQPRLVELQGQTLGFVRAALVTSAHEQPAKPSASPAEAPSFDLRIEPRSLDDIRALGCNSPDDEREFAAVARVSDLNNALYATYLQPWVKAMSSPQLARAALQLNPLRLSYSLLSDMNPMMHAVAPLAEKARAERTVAADDNPFVAMQEQFSQAMIDALDLYRDARDQLTEQMFHAVYGSPVVQAACGISRNDGPPRPRPGLSPSSRAAVDAEVARLKERIAEGSALEAAARALVYIAKAERRVEERTFDALRKLLLAHPEVSPADFKTALREQWAILTIDERAAIETLPQLLPPDAAERRSLLENVRAIVTAAGNLGADGRRRLSEIEALFKTSARRGSPTPAKGHVAAE